MKIKIHYAWVICIGCAVLIFCTSGLAINAFTIYQPYIRDANGFSNTQTSLIVTFRSLFGFISMLFVRKFYSVFSLRAGMTLSGMVLTASYLLFAFSKKIIWYCIASGISGIAYGFGTMVPVALLLERWFIKNRNTAIGICSASTGLATLGIPSLISNCIDSYGLKYTFLVEALVITLLIIVAFLLIRNSPEEMNTKPFGLVNEKIKVTGIIKGLTKNDWGFAIPAILLIGGMTSAAFSHLTVLSIGEGFSSANAAVAVMVAGVLMTIGKFVYGRIGDRLTNYVGNYIFGGILLLGLILICICTGSITILYLGMGLYGFGLAVTTVGLTAWAGDWTSKDNYDITIQRFQLLYAIGSFIFAPFPGIVADFFNGNYIPAYVFFAVSTIFILIVVQRMYLKYKR